MKAMADVNLNVHVAQMMEFVYDRGKTIVEKGENKGYQHFLLVFKRLLPRGCWKPELCSTGLIL